MKTKTVATVDGVNRKSVFMRQTTIPLDINEVPDHQIT